MEDNVLLTILLLVGISLLQNDETHALVCSEWTLPTGLKYNGHVHSFSGLLTGYSAPFLCYDIYYESSTTLKCLAYEIWSDPSPPCKPFECSSVCLPKYGAKIEVQGWGVDDQAMFSCKAGYWYAGENPRICQRNGTWTGEEGQCLKVQCPPPKALSNGNARPSPPYTYGTELRVSCNTGFVYNGSDVLICSTDNTWKGTLGQCLNISLIICEALLSSNERLVEPSFLEPKFGARINITCAKGFIYNGTRERTCKTDRTWSGYDGQCNVITCPPYIPDGNGWVEPVCSPCEYDTTIRVICPEGYMYNGSTLTCDENGRWNGVFGNCTAILCESILIANGHLNASGSVYMDEVNVTCDPGFRWEGNSTIAVCTCNGTWDLNGTCIEWSVVHYASSILGDKNISLTLGVLATIIFFIILVSTGKRISRRYRERGTDEENVPLILVHEDVVQDDIKSAVLKGGHIINRDPDKTINLDIQFITLRLVTGEPRCEINDHLPDHYLRYLQRSGWGNIEIDDLLKHVKDQLLPVRIENTENKSIETKYVRKKKPLLLEGRGGVGKSTLIQKLMRLWAQNVWAQVYKAAFLFNIRSLTVVDKRPVTLVDFFRLFGVYMLRDVTDKFHKSTLKDEKKIIIFIDGLDEFPGLSARLTKEKHKVYREAEPLTWCLDILQRHVLGETVLILASRPFRDLADLNCDPVLEVAGLTSETILEFIDHHVEASCIERVRKAMMGNKVVMSTSSITYFCMLFCQVLEKNEDATLDELTTYTRIASFFMKNYIKRCPGNPMVQLSSCLRRLAKLAFNGLSENRVDTDLAKLVFDDADLTKVQMTKDDVAVSSECGILVSYKVPQSEDEQSTREARFTYEFVHLSVQELLAMMELYQRDSGTLMKTASMMWKSSSFNMAKMYLCGIVFDSKSPHIQDLKRSMFEENNVSMAQDTKKKAGLLSLLTRVTSSGPLSNSQDFLQCAQLTYETQNQEVVRKITDVFFEGSSEMKVSNTLLTAVDMSAIAFMLKQSTHIAKLWLEGVTMDEACIERFRNLSINELSLKGTSLSDKDIKQILQIIPQSNQKVLILQLTVDEKSFKVVADGLATNLDIQSIDLQGEPLYSDTIKEVMRRLIPNRTLRTMWLTYHTGYTSTLVSVPETGRRVRVEAGQDFTNLYAWTPDDLQASSVLHHGEAKWGGDELGLILDDQLSSIYGDIRSVVQPDVWSGVLDDVICSTHRVRSLRLELSSSTPLTPLLITIKSHWGALIDNRVERVEIDKGEVTCCDLHSWYTSITTQQGWSVNVPHDMEGKVVGAEITNREGQSIAILLWWTRIRTSHQEHQDLLEEVPGLLDKPKWLRDI